MREGRINKIWGIVEMLIVLEFICTPMVKKVLINTKSVVVTLILALIFSILLLKNGFISKTQELCNLWKETNEIEKMYKELKNIKDTDFYTVYQGGKTIEVSLSSRDKNSMIDDLIRRCDLYINYHNVQKRLSKGSYEESISTVKTIRSLAEKMKCP